MNINWFLALRKLFLNEIENKSERFLLQSYALRIESTTSK